MSISNYHPTPSTSIKIIFLDFDGVLNSVNYYKSLFAQNILPDDKLDPKAIILLNKITDATGACIVVSSSWRIGKSTSQLQNIFNKHHIHGSIVGVTPDNDLPRGLQIQQWMDDSNIVVDSFLILDDDNDMHHLSGNLIKTCIQDGLTNDCVIAAIKMLGING